MIKFFFIIFTSIAAMSFTGTFINHSARTEDDNMKIKLIINKSEFTATIHDNPTAKDFISLLPLTLKLEDYASTEKISHLPRKLSLKDAPSGYDPSIGDITYYSPWGNLALFYKDFRYASGLVLLGKLDNPGEFFQKCGYSCKVKLEKIAPDQK